MAVEPVSTLAATPLDTLSMALLAQQLPSLHSFSCVSLDRCPTQSGPYLRLRVSVVPTRLIAVRLVLDIAKKNSTSNFELE